MHCSRLSPEKRPERAVGALAELRRRGVPAVLVMAGDGPRRAALQAQAGGLPVRFLRHVADRGLLARLLATADVAIAPGPAETFGLSALEALASGTPVVVSSRSALPEVIGPAGLTAEDNDASCADAVERLLRQRRGQPQAAGPGPGRAVRLAYGGGRFPRAHGLGTTALRAEPGRAGSGRGGAR